MNDRITAGGMVITEVLAVSFAAIRYAISPPSVRGRHRAQRGTVLDEASLNELLGPWPQPAYGAAVAQAWRDCPTCAKATAGVVQRDGWWCGECLRPSGGAA